jgi:hypothetical protein
MRSSPAGLVAGAVGVVIALAAVLTGCVQTTGGTAIKAAGAGGPGSTNVPPLKEAQLDRILLPVRDINSIVGGKNMQVTTSAEDMTDHSDVISDKDCLGAVYGAETPVYAGSGWTAVRDQVVREPTSDNDHWVEQAAVLLPSADNANKFFAASADQWQKCANSAVAVDDSDHTARYIWNFESVQKAGAQMITQNSSQEDSNGWACQHALGVVSNVITQGFACGYDISDEAEQIVTEIIDNAAKQ